jgi:hypothetical protein
MKTLMSRLGAGVGTGGVLMLITSPAMAGSIPAIPEPSTLSLMAAAGAVGVVMLLRKYKK